MTKTAETHIRKAVLAAVFTSVAIAAYAFAPGIGPVFLSNSATATHVDEAFDVTADAYIVGGGSVTLCEFTIDGSSWSPAALTVVSTGSVRCSASPACGDGESLTINIRATNDQNETGTGTARSRICDAAGPAGGSVSYVSGNTSSPISVTHSAGTDAGSGLGTTVLEKAEAARSGGACGAFGAWTTVGVNPSSPQSVSFAKKTCIQFRLRASDVLGHQTTYEPGIIAWRN